jgi:hypothetical protein
MRPRIRFRRLCLLFVLSCAVHASTARADIVTNRIGSWKFDEASGTTASDSSGNGSNGTLVNAPIWVTPGKVGTAALAFNGVDSYVDAGQNSVLNVANNILTLGAWVRRSNANAEGFIVTRGLDGIAGYAFALGGAGCGANQIRLSKYVIAHLCLGNFPADTSWHHVAVVAGGSGVTSYVDGVNVGGDPDASDFVSAPGATFYAGTYDPVDGFLAAQIDEVRVFARALSPADITELCACGASSTTWTREPSGFTVIEETGWESGTLGNWTLIHTHPSKPITVINIADSPMGESKALQIAYLQGHQGGGGTELRHTIAVENQSTEIYVGYYVQVNSLWQGHDSAINKMIYLSDDPVGFSAMWYEMFGADCCAENLGLYVVDQSGSDVPPPFEVVPNKFIRGRWHKVEIYQKQGISNDGIINVWVDGVLAFNQSNVDTRDNNGVAAPFDNVTISGIWGGVGDVKQQADYMRFDHIRISRR